MSCFKDVPSHLLLAYLSGSRDNSFPKWLHYLEVCNLSQLKFFITKRKTFWWCFQLGKAWLPMHCTGMHKSVDPNANNIREAKERKQKILERNTKLKANQKPKRTKQEHRGQKRNQKKKTKTKEWWKNRLKHTWMLNWWNTGKAQEKKQRQEVESKTWHARI